VATDTAPDFDLGPLTWVQGEIDQALTRGLEALAVFKASPREITSLKHARSHVHQAAGAIQMVGLDAVTAYTDELERQLNRVEELPPREAQDACDLIDRACRKLKIFLDELVGGAYAVPLRLFPEYEQMQQARGVKASAPTDLFFPDLSPRAPKIASVKTVASQKLPSFLIKQRRLYQRGLLAWLHGDEEAARAMRDAIQGIEDVQTHSAQRSFWWTVGALLESIVEKGVESGFGIKQLCGRVDLQIRRYVEGSAKVADRMRREVLYYVAISAPVGPQVQAVQRAYQLPGLIPTAEALSADVVRVQPLLREARELLSSTKDLWLKLTSGRQENLPKLKQNLSQLRDTTTAIGEPSLSRLAATLASRLDKIGAAAIAGLTVVTLALVVGQATFPITTLGTPGGVPDVTKALGNLLMGPFLLPFEIAGLLLLASMIGAIVIARES
jgi:chemosensory pili system protein ChpA (sensor histidine kinase/response regulator)